MENKTRIGKEIATMDESAKEGKTLGDIFRRKDQNKTGDKSENTTLEDKFKKYGGRKNTLKIREQNKAINTQ